MTVLIFGLLWGIWLATLGASLLPVAFDGVARLILMWCLLLHGLYGLLLGLTLERAGALDSAKNAAFIGALATGVVTYIGSAPITAIIGALYGALFGFSCYFSTISLNRRMEGSHSL